LALLFSGAKPITVKLRAQLGFFECAESKKEGKLLAPAVTLTDRTRVGDDERDGIRLP
jgi:hypothetical protein